MKPLKDYIKQHPDVRTYASGSVFPNHTLVGVEVELEKYAGKPEQYTYWRAEHDGSLREGGIEFVLAQPLTGIDLEKSLVELKSKVLDTKYEVNQRCSTHVHLDARDMTVEHLRAMVFVYCMVERMLYDCVAPSREDSFYCTPLYKSTQHRRVIARALHELSFEDCPKYSGLNLRTLLKYGSLEFRMYEGLSKDTDIQKWIMLLLQLKAGTEHLAEVPLKSLLDRYSQNSALSIIREVFGTMADELIQGKDYNKRLKNSMRSAQDLILFLPDYSNTLRKTEREWLNAARGKNAGDIPGIDPELLEILRNKRDEILGQ